MKYKITYQENGKLKYKTINIDGKISSDLLELPKNIIDIKQQKSFSKNIKLFQNHKQNIFNMFKQLSIMLNSNLTLSESISLLLKAKNDKLIIDILTTIQNSIKSSTPIDKSLERYGYYLGSTPILFLKLGIENGNIKQSINSLVQILEETTKSKKKLLQTLRYPMVLILSLFVAMVMVFVYVIPNFEFIFTMLEDKIPFSTKILLLLKDVIYNYYLLILLFFMVLIVAIFSIYKSKKLMFDKFFILKIPIFSNVLKDYYFYRLFLLISVIVKSKYQFQTAILNSKNIIENEYIKNNMLHILSNIKNGISISDSFKNTNLFDDLTIKLLYTAEQTNNYEDILTDICNYYKNKFSESLNNLSSFLEPFIVLLISLIVLWLVFAIMLPIWDMQAILN